MTWTPAALDLLTSMWADGRSATEISRDMWVRLRIYATRNAVIGKVHRLNLPKRAPRPPSKAAARKGSRLRTDRLVLPRRPKPPARLMKPVPIRRRPEAPSEAPMPKNLTLMELTERTCKWPVNEPVKGAPHLFCGEAKEPGREPYCPYHTRLAWGSGTPSERRVYREMRGRVAA